LDAVPRFFFDITSSGVLRWIIPASEV
jgi:hypothetical protein